MRDEKVVSIYSNQHVSREPCGACKRPLTEKHYSWLGKSGAYNYLICSGCYEFLQLSEGEKHLYLLKIKERKRLEMERKQCSNCKEGKTEGVRTFEVEGKIRYICNACIAKIPDITATEKMLFNKNELMSKKAIAKSLGK